MSQRDLNVEYLFILRNGESDWNSELSYDENGMFSFSLVFVYIYKIY